MQDRALADEAVGELRGFAEQPHFDNAGMLNKPPFVQCAQSL